MSDYEIVKARNKELQDENNLLKNEIKRLVNINKMLRSKDQDNSSVTSIEEDLEGDDDCINVSVSDFSQTRNSGS